MDFKIVFSFTFHTLLSCKSNTVNGCSGKLSEGYSLVKSLARSRALDGTQLFFSSAAMEGLSPIEAYFSLVTPST